MDFCKMAYYKCIIMFYAMASNIMTANSTVNNTGTEEMTDAIDLGEYLESIETDCPFPVLSLMREHIIDDILSVNENMADAKVIIFIATAYASKCPQTALCVAKEFLENYRNHFLPVQCSGDGDSGSLNGNLESANLALPTAAQEDDVRIKFYSFLAHLVRRYELKDNSSDAVNDRTTIDSVIHEAYDKVEKELFSTLSNKIIRNLFQSIGFKKKTGPESYNHEKKPKKGKKKYNRTNARKKRGAHLSKSEIDRNYFVISSMETAKVLDAKSSTKIQMWDYHGRDNQLWFWEGDSIRSKKYPNKVIHFPVQEYENSDTHWAKIKLHDYLGRQNQKWEIKDEKIVSQYKYLPLNIGGHNKNNGAEVGCYKLTDSFNLNEMWYLENPVRLYFTISNKNTGKVLDAPTPNRIHTWNYHGEDHQLWFISGDAIRSKKYPTKVVDFHKRDFTENDSKWAKIYLHPYNGGENQKWNMNDQQLVLNWQNLTLSVKDASSNNGAKAGCQSAISSTSANNMWALEPGRSYFVLSSKETSKVFRATSSSNILMYNYDGSDSQLWFWEGDSIRSKKYPDKVVDLNILDYENSDSSWGKVYLHKYHGGKNQLWKLEDDKILSQYKNLPLNIAGHNKQNGAKVGCYKLTTTFNLNEMWSFGDPKRHYFIISSSHSAKVLDAPDSKSIHMWDYHGLDNQLWFFDGNTLRSKKYPDKVIDFHTSDFKNSGTQWGKIYLHSYHGGENQRWKTLDGKILSEYKDLPLNVKGGNLNNRAEVGCYKKTASFNINELWTISQDRTFFMIYSKGTSKVVDAASDTKIHMHEYHGKDNQIWFWDANTLRSKKYPQKVIDFHISEYLNSDDKWGNIYLNQYNGGNNQKWKNSDDKLLSFYRDLPLNIKGGDTSNEAKVGCYKITTTFNRNEQWTMSPPKNNKETKGCGDKTEQDIYSVVQWFPLISTLWDCISAAVYAGTGCKSLAEERGISAGIGLAMDIGTALTLGAGSAAFQGIKSGAKAGVNFGIKQAFLQSMKAIPTKLAKVMSKGSIKKFAQKLSTSSLKETLMDAGKFVAKEVALDDLQLYKSISKMGKTFVKSPLKSTVDVGTGLIDNIKNGAKKAKDIKNIKLSDMKHKLKAWAEGGGEKKLLVSKIDDLSGDICKRFKRGIRVKRCAVQVKNSNSWKLENNHIWEISTDKTAFKKIGVEALDEGITTNRNVMRIQLKGATKNDEKILVLMYNPSKSGQPGILDPTTESLIRMADQQKYGSLDVINLFTLREPKSNVLDEKVSEFFDTEFLKPKNPEGVIDPFWGNDIDMMNKLADANNNKILLAFGDLPRNAKDPRILAYTSDLISKLQKDNEFFAYTLTKKQLPGHPNFLNRLSQKSGMDLPEIIKQNSVKVTNGKRSFEKTDLWSNKWRKIEVQSSEPILKFATPKK